MVDGDKIEVGEGIERLSSALSSALSDLLKAIFVARYTAGLVSEFRHQIIVFIKRS